MRIKQQLTRGTSINVASTTAGWDTYTAFATIVKDVFASFSTFRESAEASFHRDARMHALAVRHPSRLSAASTLPTAAGIRHRGY